MKYPNPLQYEPPKVETGFNAHGYERFMADNFTIIDKNKEEVPFNVNDAQHAFNAYMESYFNLIILKARKMGFSSDVLGIATAKFLMGRNENVVSMSFDAGASGKQLDRVKHYIKSYERKNNVKIPFKYNSKTELVWEGEDEKGTFKNTIRVGTAKSTGFGRGDDITFLHLTEVSLCDDIPTLLAGVGEALVAGAHTILETTANGFNSYKKFWDGAVDGINGFAPLFFSPEWEYDEEYLENRRKKLGRLFLQEYPMSPQEAFITSGLPFFSADAMYAYLNKVSEKEVTT